MRGTTPTHLFTLPFDTALIKSIKITYAHNKIPVLIKQTEDCTLEDHTVTVRLTQEETLLFENNWVVEVQLRVLMNNGDAIRSKVYNISAGVLLDDEVLV